jgi:hypothetical protein
MQALEVGVTRTGVLQSANLHILMQLIAAMGVPNQVLSVNQLLRRP